MSINQPRSTWLWKTCFHRKAHVHILLFLQWTVMVQRLFLPLPYPDSKEACDWESKHLGSPSGSLTTSRAEDPHQHTQTTIEPTTFTKVCDWRNPYSLRSNIRSGLIFTEWSAGFPTLPHIIHEAILLSVKQHFFFAVNQFVFIKSTVMLESWMHQDKNSWVL